MLFAIFAAVQALLLAQQPVAPTTESVGPARGENAGGYNVVNSFETGYRLNRVGGDRGMYRSTVNFGDGVRLLSSGLTVHSKEGQGGLFDEIVLNTQGLGNDPYQSAVLRIQKNSLYRYDLLWRLDEYYNPALTVSFGEHLMNTRRRLQDHELILLPQSKFRLLLGYTRNSQDGPALSTVQQLGARGDEFPFFGDVRRVRNEYRIGGDLQMFGVKLTLMRGWDDFKEDTPYVLRAPEAGNNPDDRNTASEFARREPYHGTSPYWRAGLFKERKSWSAAARYQYVEGRRRFLFDELFSGNVLSGIPRVRQIAVYGDARRPVSSGSLTLSFYPGSRITVTNHTSFHNTRMEGDSAYSEFNNALRTGDIFFFNRLAIRTIANATDLDYRAAKWLGFRAGYHYSSRRIQSSESFEVPGPLPETAASAQENRMHSGLFGLRLRPARPLTISLDGEIARHDRPFTPVAERNFHGFAGRVQYKATSVVLAAAARSSYNTNSVSLSSYSSRGRNYSLDASWAPRGWLALDAGYSKLHLDTASGLAYFASGSLLSDRSIYVSNVHAGNLGLRLAVHKRADVLLGYSRVQDLGEGRAAVPADPFVAARSLPLTFESPLGRLSVRLLGKLRWNLGYQYYRYGETFYSFQNYRAHTGYSSVLWSF